MFYKQPHNRFLSIPTGKVKRRQRKLKKSNKPTLNDGQLKVEAKDTLTSDSLLTLFSTKINKIPLETKNDKKLTQFSF